MRKHPALVIAVVIGVVVLIAVFHRPPFQTVIAGLLTYGIFRLGTLMLGGLARPIPEPPPKGELRKVKITYRCSICGTEVRMTAANDEVPEPPRHCLEDMDLVAPIDDL